MSSFTLVHLAIFIICLLKGVRCLPCECGAYGVDPQGNLTFIYSTKLMIPKCDTNFCKLTCVRMIRRFSDNENPMHMLQGYGLVGDLICSRNSGKSHLRLLYKTRVCFNTRWDEAGISRSRLCCTDEGKYTPCD